MSLELTLEVLLKSRGVDFVHFVDVSNLLAEQNKGYPNAILFGIALSPAYLQKISNTPDFVQNLIRNNLTHEDEFHQKEKFTDKLADELAAYLQAKGHAAYSQSEDNINSTGFYDTQTKTTPLPHKTIAGLAGMGWIGKHNLLVTPEFGSAISMCTVLTHAPLKTVLHAPAEPQCGNCSICQEVCMVNAISGNAWEVGISRDLVVNVYRCTTCLKCLVHCPYTQLYIKK